MKNFMDENFLAADRNCTKSCITSMRLKCRLLTTTVILIPQMVADDYKFKSLTEIWLGGDITNGVQCVQMAQTNAIVQEKIPQTGKVRKMG